MPARLPPVSKEGNETAEDSAAIQNSGDRAEAASADVSYTTMASTQDGITVDFTSEEFLVLPEREKSYEKEKSVMVVKKMK